MLLRQPIMQGGRQEQRLVHIRRPKALSHARILSPNTLWKSCYVWYFGRISSRQTPRQSRNAYSDEIYRDSFQSSSSREHGVVTSCAHEEQHRERKEEVDPGAQHG